MNRLKQIGIQVWRLKPEFTVGELGDAQSRPAESAAQDSTTGESFDASPAESNNHQEVREESSAKQYNTTGELGWRELSGLLEDATHCSSCAQNTAILGEGNPRADWLFVIDSPSQRDIEKGQLLSGRDGQLFEAILRAIGLNRDDAYLTSVFKCAPPAELTISPQCNDIVHRQIELVQPKFVVCLGEFTTQTLLRANQGLSELRVNNAHQTKGDAKLVATHALGALLENPALKAQLWADLQTCLQ